MKSLKIFALVVSCAFAFASCSNYSAEIPEGITKGQCDSASYAIGVSFGSMLKQSQIESVNFDMLIKGMKEIMALDPADTTKKLSLTDDEINNAIQGYMMASQQAVEQAKVNAENEYLEGVKNENANVKSTESGLLYEIIEAGNQEMMPAATDTVAVNYSGALKDGSVFDSSEKNGGEPVEFVLNRVIPGWTEGLQLIGEGGKIKLWVPFKLGYGPRAMSAELPAYSTLVFDVELVKVAKVPASEETIEIK